MEINISIRNIVQNVEDVPAALLALSGGSFLLQEFSLSGRVERHHNEHQLEGRHLTASARELSALQEIHDEHAEYSSTDARPSARSIWTSIDAEAARPRVRPRPFSVFQQPPRQHAGRTISPRPYFQRNMQVGAGDVVPQPRPSSTQNTRSPSTRPPRRRSPTPASRPRLPPTSKPRSPPRTTRPRSPPPATRF